ncbi:aldehyde dehydrogenase family protein [Prauserella cavernicola]|uniref:Aldehyde dehydrogenase family protein n=1 Tax=Prauserella cavernicola TaxID=2800127 RepID=A0A934V7E2_9PSEU|nr:aldehyde dehydrogenase family protein [Prauserella cavernicola]MBK1787150.1 aldehyde dehydrogenase family protein [Prauserella cavernicola]
MLFPANETNLQHHTFAQLIDGELVPGAGTSEVIDPGTGEAIAIAPAADDDQVGVAVDAAQTAFRTWRRTPLAERATALRRIADAVEEHADEFARVLALETGKPLAMARDMELDWAIRWVRHFAELDLTPEVLRTDEDYRVERHHEPLGVVAAIVPWNFPLFQSLYKIAPAILAGNTVVLKPAPTTPLHALFLGELLREILPAGVVNILGDGAPGSSVGPTLANHPAVRLVSFTGSTAAGRKVLSGASSTIKRVVLELGGNDAAIVLPDADVETVAPQIFTWTFNYAGQLCVGIKRIFVPDAMYERFAEIFAELAVSRPLGHALDADADAAFGPLQNAAQFERVKGYLAQAHADGKVIAGGTVDPRPGYFVPPTVVRDIGDDSVLVREETFGPVRSLLRYSDLDDAVARANDTTYGLGNSVWATDTIAAARVAERLESGTVWINTHVGAYPEVPFGGLKQSGVGTEFGIQGLHEFVENKVIYVPVA